MQYTISELDRLIGKTVRHKEEGCYYVVHDYFNTTNFGGEPLWILGKRNGSGYMAWFDANEFDIFISWYSAQWQRFGF